MVTCFQVWVYEGVCVLCGEDEMTLYADLFTGMSIQRCV